jgi:hypothetical protein
VEAVNSGISGFHDATVFPLLSITIIPATASVSPKKGKLLRQMEEKILRIHILKLLHGDGRLMFYWYKKVMESCGEKL